MKTIMIQTIREHWFYKEGQLEEMTEEAVREIYERLLDWLE